MAISTVIAGAYTSTLAAAAMGFTQDGFTISRVNHQEEINQTDLYAKTLIDTIYQGGDTFVQTIARVMSVASHVAFWPFIAASGTYSDVGTLWTAAAPIATLGSGKALSLVLTVVANTPAASAADPTSLTASKALIAPGYNTDILFSSRSRTVPIRFVCLPTDTAGTGTSFTAT